MIVTLTVNKYEGSYTSNYTSKGVLPSSLLPLYLGKFMLFTVKCNILSVHFSDNSLFVTVQI